MDKRANILTENVIFIALTLIFLTILTLFLFSRMGAAAVLEEKYAKQIALLIDSAKLPKMEIVLNMKDAFEKAKDEKFDFKKVVSIQDNIVTVRLKEGTGYSYSFFNEVYVNPPYPSKKSYVFIIEDKTKNENVEE